MVTCGNNILRYRREMAPELVEGRFASGIIIPAHDKGCNSSVVGAGFAGLRIKIKIARLGMHAHR